jgi:RNA polymerase sigma-70 factor (ECF subfamily)
VRPAPRPAAADADADLLRQIAGGDLHALGVLFEAREPDIKRFIGRLGVAPSEIDDLVQLTFLDIARAAHKYDPWLPANSWLFGLALIVVRRHRRSIVRSAMRLLRWSSEPASFPVQPDELVENRDLAEKASRVLARLSVKKREVFVMVVLEGVAGEDAARALGIPVGTVWTRLHHARVELRRALAKESR